jgi:hypothetical protein
MYMLCFNQVNPLYYFLFHHPAPLFFSSLPCIVLPHLHTQMRCVQYHSLSITLFPSPETKPEIHHAPSHQTGRKFNIDIGDSLPSCQTMISGALAGSVISPQVVCAESTFKATAPWIMPSLLLINWSLNKKINASVPPGLRVQGFFSCSASSSSFFPFLCLFFE